MTHVDFLSQLLEENYAHARLHEEHRASCTNFILAIAVGLLATGTQVLDSRNVAVLFGLAAAMSGAVGAMFAIKHFERYRYHLKVASVLRDEIESVLLERTKKAAEYSEILSKATREHHAGKLFRQTSSSTVPHGSPDRYLKEFRLHSLYHIVNYAAVFSGIAFAVYALFIHP